MRNTAIRMIVLAMCLTAVAYAEPFNFQIGVVAGGGIDGLGTLGHYPAGFGPANCTAVTDFETSCGGGNFVGAGQTFFLGINPGGSISDAGTWSSLLHVTAGNMTLYTGNTFNYVQILTDFGWFFPGITPDQYNTYFVGPRYTNNGGDSGDITVVQGIYSVEIFNPETATPEPGSLVLLGSGLVGLGGALRRKFIA